MNKWELVRVVPDHVQDLVGVARALSEIAFRYPVTFSTEEKELLEHASKWLEQLVLENRDLKAVIETLRQKLKDLPLKRI